MAGHFLKFFFFSRHNIRFWRFFTDGWSVFDFFVVVVGLVSLVIGGELFLFRPLMFSNCSYFSVVVGLFDGLLSRVPRVLGVGFHHPARARARARLSFYAKTTTTTTDSKPKRLSFYVGK